MRWKGQRESQNIEDRRGVSAGKAAGGGIGVVLIAIVVMLLGGDPTQLLQASGTSAPAGSQNYKPTPENEEMRAFISTVLAKTEDIWTPIFAQMGKTYDPPRLVLFTDKVESACGFASAAVGPFYCSEDESVYLDTSFFEEMKRKLGGGGDFAYAYVIAHEVGHHVQHELGTLGQVQQARQRMSEKEGNALTVRLELQADFYAGLWAHYSRDDFQIDEQDIREAMNTAEAIGDDKLQMQAQGYVVPDSFTHGSSDQRVRWFMKGFKTGDITQGDTFRQSRL